ncbi:hypothetical protein [Methyloceanibacter caenitepidi]|uniref:Uncharacterized protein n=1 Tax=Methyloceanibacter caenitepidi TaxID=1384459 RepID=A0A0A8K320_9HYPH|nr:hypothetical protein [Methyloceanibacter caenitepidi]BAQ16907.1 hypothetical protein GL4_1451 [Methyloceanibacter caenitepidi]
MVDRTTKPHVPLENPNDVEHRRQLAQRANASFPKDGSEGMRAPLRLFPVTVADLSTDVYAPSLWAESLVFVSDGSAGQKLRYSDGNTWIILG